MICWFHFFVGWALPPQSKTKLSLSLMKEESCFACFLCRASAVASSHQIKIKIKFYFYFLQFSNYWYNIFFNLLISFTNSWNQSMKKEKFIFLLSWLSGMNGEWFVARSKKKVNFTFFNYAVAGYGFWAQQTHSFIHPQSTLINLINKPALDWRNKLNFTLLELIKDGIE